MVSMKISTREKIIIDHLFDNIEGLTIKELSKKIDVSPRTIHRDLTAIEKIVEKYDLELIRKTGVGIQLNGSDKSKQSLKEQISEYTTKEYTLDERLTLILCTLYESPEPVKLFSLAHALSVAIATISSDLTKLEEQLKPFELSILKKRGYGIEMEGSEKAKRRAISYMMAQSLKEDELLSFVKQQVLDQSWNYPNAVSKRLLHLVDREKLVIVEEVMQEIYSIYSFPITDNAHVGLIVHLTLALDRIQLGESIQIDAGFLIELKKEPEYKMAQRIIQQLAERFSIQIPEAEIGYITMHLQGAKLTHSEGELLESSNLETTMQAKKLIQWIEDETGVELMNNEALLEGLVTHLKPAIYRIQQQMGITNPLLKSIQKNYGELFYTMKKSVKKVFPDLQIPDAEIGFLVMHFGSVLLNPPGIKDLKAYIVCASGIGTSKMLASQLQQEVPEIGDIVNISIQDLKAMKIDDRDLLISTIHLPGFSKEYLLVSPMISSQEINQVQMYAKRQILLKKASDNPKTQNFTVEELTDTLSNIQLYAETATQVLKNFSLVLATESKSAKDVLHDACLALEQRLLIGSAVAVLAALFEREAMGGIGIPGTQFAFFHTRHEDVYQPSFTIYSLKEPVMIRGVDGVDLAVDRLLLLLAPTDYHDPGLEILSYISILLIENEDSSTLFSTGEATQIHRYLAEKFHHFIGEKIN